MREITTEYLQEFVTSIAKGNPVTFTVAQSLLAVDHPSKGYLVIQLADKVVDKEQEVDKTTHSEKEISNDSQ